MKKKYNNRNLLKSEEKNFTSFIINFKNRGSRRENKKK